MSLCPRSPRHFIFGAQLQEMNRNNYELRDPFYIFRSDDFRSSEKGMNFPNDMYSSLSTVGVLGKHELSQGK